MGKGPFGTLQSGVIPFPFLGGVGLVPDDTALRTVVRHLVLSDLSDAIRLAKLGIHAVIIVLVDGEGVVDLRAVRQIVTLRSLGLDKPVRTERQICELERILGRIDVLIGVILRGGALVGAVSNVASALNIVAVGILQFPLAARQYRHPVRGIDLAPADPTVRRIGDRYVVAQHSTGGLSIIDGNRNGRLLIIDDVESVSLTGLHISVRSLVLFQPILSFTQVLDLELARIVVLIKQSVVFDYRDVLSLELRIVAVSNRSIVRNLAPLTFFRGNRTRISNVALPYEAKI